VTFTVDNDGFGVPAEEVERIFDVYVSRKEGGAQGVGLGLPLSRRLARLLGGELRAVPLPDRGRFVLELPATPDS
jgi:signal transduction histidine kinase